MKIKILSIVLLLISLNSLTAQSTVYGVKGGLTAANQRFDGGSTYNNSLLFKYHGALFIENAPEDATSVLFAQAGFHTRGHARRYQRGVTFNYQTGQLQEISGFKEEFVFNNLGLVIGVKRRGVLNNANAYYALGLRAEYTISNNLPGDNSSLPSIYALYYPSKDFVRKFNYGLTLSGGYEFPFSELIGGFVELNVHPDLSKQYFQPAIVINSTNPITGESVGTIPEQSIRNLTFEISIGFRFLRKVVYVN